MAEEKLLASEVREIRLAETAHRVAAENSACRGEFKLSAKLCRLFSLPEGQLVTADEFGQLVMEANAGKKRAVKS